MEPWAIFILVLTAAVVLGLIAQRLGWIDLSREGRTSGSVGVASVGDEIFHPTRHEARIELDRQATLPAPAPSPRDGDLGVYDGQVRIDLKPGLHRRDGSVD